MDKEEDGDEDSLCLFGSSVSVNISYTFLDCRPLSSIDDIGKESIMQPARFDVWVEAVLICFRHRETRR